MAGIIPIPTTRVGDFFMRQRLTDQMQRDQIDLFRLQNQISTGQRLQLPSDDAPSALRAINLQRLLDRKGQIATNLQASNFYLSAAENSLGVIGQQLSEVRAGALSVADTVATDEQRRTVIQQIDRALQLLVDTGNAKSQGRYLFAGSRSQNMPYGFNGDFVQFSGNEGILRSYVDVDRLFETNLSGTEVFGGISSQLEGRADLDPQLSSATLVSTLNGGNGIGRNPTIAVSINTGLSTETKIVDLRGAVTVDDVARLIEKGAPGTPGNVHVNVTGTGLAIQSDDGPISISEVAQGSTARQLGILSDPNAAPTSSITGGNLNPAVLKTTRISDLLGTKAQGAINPAGVNNGIRLTAAANGTSFNNVNVVFVDSVAAGAEVATYNAGTNTLTVTIEGGMSSANQVIAAINAEGTFSATADYHDSTSFVQIGTGTVQAGSYGGGGVITGGGGTNLDTQSGLILTNGGESVTLDISGAKTVEELLNLITGAGIGLVAEINADRDGINVRSRLSGADFTIGENGGTTATQLGIRTYTGDTKLSELNRGAGVPTTADLEQLDTSKLDNLQITARNGVSFNVNVSSATSMQQIVDAINTHSLNNFGTTFALARVSANGNGIEIVDSSVPITNDLQIGATQASAYLGLSGSSHTTNADGHYVKSGGNVLGHDLMIQTRNGTQVWIDLAGAKTVQDVIDRINNDPENSGLPRPVTARLAVTGNGIELVDSTAGAGSLTVQAGEGSEAAHYLGFIAKGQTQASSTTGVMQSEDRNTLETDSVFNSLLRLKRALEAGDVTEIGRSIDRLDTDMERVNFARAEIGARLQNLDVIGVRWEDENVQLKGALSQEIDVDLVEAISNLTARQYAFEASLRTAASMMQMSLLNFL